MAAPELLNNLLYFLLAATISVPLFVRLRLGTILGYLIAGFVIGPPVLGLISDPESVLHFSEFGVILLLFNIGLELKPEKLWSMRGQIFFLGGGQLLASSVFICFLIYFLLKLSFGVSVIVSLAFALSSTAFAIQLMSDKGLLASDEGRRGFSILLMQDIAVIPILFLIQVYSGDSDSAGQSLKWYAGIAVLAMIFIGRYLLDPILKLSARYGSRETMSATALLIVVAASFSMAKVGLSMGLGAFIAGILLANSNYRHEIEANIDPFKGLTLGLFFIAIGMTLNVGIFLKNPVFFLLAAIGLMLVKMCIVGLLVRMSGSSWRDGFHLGAVLSQGGEFGFVLMSQSVGHHIISPDIAAAVNFIITTSMAMTVPFVMICEAFSESNKRAKPKSTLRHYSSRPEVMILGFGRFGQISGRILAAKKIPFSALDRDPEHIQFIKNLGSKVYYGDVTRMDLLRFAGIDYARVVLVAIGNPEVTFKVVTMLRKHYPDIKLIVRARNRPEYQQLIQCGADVVVRELFAGSLDASVKVLINLGYSVSEALKIVDLFRQHDEELLRRTVDLNDLDRMIEIGKQGRVELEKLFKEDKGEKEEKITTSS